MFLQKTRCQEFRNSRRPTSRSGGTGILYSYMGNLMFLTETETSECHSRATGRFPPSGVAGARSKLTGPSLPRHLSDRPVTLCPSLPRHSPATSQLLPRNFPVTSCVLCVHKEVTNKHKQTQTTQQHKPKQLFVTRTCGTYSLCV